MLERLTEVFCEIDDFCQAFEAQWQAYLLGSGTAPRGPKSGLSVSEIITLLKTHYRVIYTILHKINGFDGCGDIMWDVRLQVSFS